jgi:hypothetical protein
MSHFETGLDKHDWHNERETYLTEGRLYPRRDQTLAELDGLIDRIDELVPVGPRPDTVRKAGRVVTISSLSPEVFAQKV